MDGIVKDWTLPCMNAGLYSVAISRTVLLNELQLISSLSCLFNFPFHIQYEILIKPNHFTSTEILPYISLYNF